MIGQNPLSSEILFHLGPIPIARAVLTTWVVMAALTFVSWFGLSKMLSDGGSLQTSLEIVVETISRQISEIVGEKTAPFLPLLGTLFLFLVTANLLAVVPGMQPPTGHIETPAALAIIVFFSVHYFGIRSRGLKAYLAKYAKPSLLLLPLNILAEITRTFSLMIRLFGNMMSHEFVLAIVVFLSGLFVPIPFMLLGLLIGLIQAYIFTVLAAVYIGAAVGTIKTE